MQKHFSLFKHYVSEIPSLPDIVSDLWKQVEKLKEGRSSNSSSVTSSSPLTHIDSDNESDMVSNIIYGSGINTIKNFGHLVRLD